MLFGKAGERRFHAMAKPTGSTCNLNVRMMNPKERRLRLAREDTGIAFDPRFFSGFLTMPLVSPSLIIVSGEIGTDSKDFADGP